MRYNHAIYVEDPEYCRARWDHAVWLRDVEGNKLEVVAIRLGINTSTARRYLVKGRRKPQEQARAERYSPRRSGEPSPTLRRGG